MLEQNRILHRHFSQSKLGSISQSGYIRHRNRIPPTGWSRFGKYAIVYIVEGEGLYEDQNKVRRRVGAGDMILVFPHLGHSSQPKQYWTEFYLIFSGPLFALWEESGLLNPQEPIHHLEPVHHWLERFESILGAPRESGWAPPVLELCRLQQVLADVFVGGAKGAAPKKDLEWVSQACALLGADLSSRLHGDGIARRFGMSYESFRKRFRRIVGMPPAKYRARKIIDRACALMQTGELSDKQIGLMLGFCDEFHFSRRFKQITGFSPRQYRRNIPVPESA